MSVSTIVANILKKSFEEKLLKEVIFELFENQNEVMDLGISAISIFEEMAKEIRDKSDVVCNFCQSAEGVAVPKELSSEKKNLMVFDVLLENKTHVNRIMSEEDKVTSIVSI